MVTDAVPKTTRLRAEYARSDRTRGLELPGDDRFLQAAECIEAALVTEEAATVRRACVEFLRLAAEYYQSPYHRFECFGRVRFVCEKAAGELSSLGITILMTDPRVDAYGDSKTRDLIWDVFCGAVP